MSYKDKLKRMSQAGISDSTIARICCISVITTRKILFTEWYEASKRTQERILTSLDNFKKELWLDN